MSALTHAVALAAAIGTALPPAAALAEPEVPPAISVTGQASVAARPDLALIDAGVASEGRSAREAFEANSKAMTKVLAALKGAGIDEKDVQTSQLSLAPQYAPNHPPPAPITSYRAGNRVRLKLRDVSRLGSILDALVAAGANDVGNIAFTVEHASELLDDARKKAFLDARRKAEIYAAAAGVSLGNPLLIAEDGAQAVAFRPRTASAAMRPSTPVAPGEETLDVTVNVSFAIKQ